MGPAAFIVAWAALGTGRRGYSPVDDPISRLAAVDASSRPAMTAGFVAFGAGVSLSATALRAVSPPAALAAAGTAVATWGVAALPLGSTWGDEPHAVAAVGAYTALAATPLLAARSCADRRASVLSTAAGLACGAALLASAIASDRVGLYQRVGLTVGDAWLAATATWLVRRPVR